MDDLLSTPPASPKSLGAVGALLAAIARPLAVAAGKTVSAAQEDLGGKVHQQHQHHHHMRPKRISSMKTQQPKDRTIRFFHTPRKKNLHFY